MSNSKTAKAIYVVKALRSRSLCRVFSVPELYNKVMEYPYVSLGFAKRKRAAMNKERVLYHSPEPPHKVIDGGPSFRKVWIEEVNE